MSFVRLDPHSENKRAIDGLLFPFLSLGTTADKNFHYSEVKTNCLPCFLSNGQFTPAGYVTFFFGNKKCRPDTWRQSQTLDANRLQTIYSNFQHLVFQYFTHQFKKKIVSRAKTLLATKRPEPSASWIVVQRAHTREAMTRPSDPNLEHKKEIFTWKIKKDRKKYIAKPPKLVRTQPKRLLHKTKPKTDSCHETTANQKFGISMLVLI